jgi:uncharacterized protein
MSKIEMEILGISYHQTQAGAYALILAEKEGKRRIPIMIGGSEAQSIAIQLEDLKPLRPLTHDLLVSVASSFGISVEEICIVKFEEGIFYSEITCERGDKKIILDSRTSDAVALALRFKCPIYAKEDVVRKAGIILEEDNKTNPNQTTKVSSTPPPQKTKFTTMTIAKLNELLEKAVADEDYELASKIRDEIKNRKK